jgi:hypothetical protein
VGAALSSSAANRSPVVSTSDRPQPGPVISDPTPDTLSDERHSWPLPSAQAIHSSDRAYWHFWAGEQAAVYRCRVYERSRPARPNFAVYLRVVRRGPRFWAGVVLCLGAFARVVADSLTEAFVALAIGSQESSRSSRSGGPWWRVPRPAGLRVNQSCSTRTRATSQCIRQNRRATFISSRTIMKPDSAAPEWHHLCGCRPGWEAKARPRVRSSTHSSQRLVSATCQPLQWRRSSAENSSPRARPPDYDESSARRDHQASAAVIALSASWMPSPTSPAVAAQCKGTRARAPGSQRCSSRVSGSGAVPS